MDFIIFKSVCLLGCLLKNGFKTTREAVLPSARGCLAEELAFPWGGGLLGMPGIPGSALSCCLLSWVACGGSCGAGRRAGEAFQAGERDHMALEEGITAPFTWSLLTLESLQVQIILQHLRDLSPRGAPISHVEHPQTAGCRQVFVDATKWSCPRTQHLSAAVG